MCHKVIGTMGTGQGQLLALIMALVAKRGCAVITNMPKVSELDVKLSGESLLT
jgi:hypothetical protein